MMDHVSGKVENGRISAVGVGCDQGFLRPRSILISWCGSKDNKTQVATYMSFCQFPLITLSKLFVHFSMFVHQFRAKEKAVTDYMATCAQLG